MLDGYKDTEIGVIPIEWEVARLEDISKITMGQSPKSDTYNTDNIGMPLIQGNADCKNRKTIPRTYTTELTKECFVGDIIMTVRAPVGAISKSLHNACIGRGVCSIKSNGANNFLYHNLVDYENKWDKLSQGSTFTAVSGSDIKNLKFPLPPLKEQEKIADILSTADDKIVAITTQIEKAETLKKGLLQKLLSEGIGHSEFKDSELGKIPESWEVVELDTLMKVKHGYAFKSNHFSAEETDNAVLTPGNVNIGGGFKKKWFRFYDDEPFPNEYILKNNDIIISMTDLTPTAQTLGFPFIISPVNNKKFLHNQRLGKIEFKSLKIFPHYMFNFLCSSRYRNNIVNGSTGTTVRHTSPSRILEEKIPLPPLKEQKQIADILSTADEKLEVLRAKKEKYETLKKGLLQKLLSGEIRVGGDCHRTTYRHKEKDIVTY